jgi:hypothetical protein
MTCGLPYRDRPRPPSGPPASRSPPDSLSPCCCAWRRRGVRARGEGRGLLAARLAPRRPGRESKSGRHRAGRFVGSTQHRRAARSARQAHNLKVVGSNPTGATRRAPARNRACKAWVFGHARVGTWATHCGELPERQWVGLLSRSRIHARVRSIRTLSAGRSPIGAGTGPENRSVARRWGFESLTFRVGEDVGASPARPSQGPRAVPPVAQQPERLRVAAGESRIFAPRTGGHLPR